jgi:hypothetical protein
MTIRLPCDSRMLRLYAAGVCPVHRWKALTKFETVE